MSIKKILLLALSLGICANLLYAQVSFYSINEIHSISVRETSSICKDSTGFIWASSKTGILRIAEDDYRIYNLPYQTTNVLNVKLEYCNNQLIAYSNNGQIFTYNSIYDRFELIANISKTTNNNFLSINQVLIDHKKSCWIASSVGLCELDKGNFLHREGDSVDINSIEWYNDHQFFLAKADGLWLFDIDNKTFQCLYRNDLLPGLIADRLYFDKENRRLWIGTISHGLFYYSINESVFKQFEIEGLPRQPILAIEPNSDSTLMLGIDGQGIWEFNTFNHKVVNIYNEVADNPTSLKGNGIYDIFRDKNHRIWVCTYSGGVSFFDQTSPLVQQIKHQLNNQNSLINNEVNDVIEDRYGNIWFATNNGISCWNIKSNTWESFYHNKKEQAQVFLSLCEDNHGQIWAGSYASGVYVIDERMHIELAHYSREEHPGTFNNNYVFDIYKDSNGDIWIVGINGTIYCYLANDKKFRSYSLQPVNDIYELQPGTMLIGCTYGLSMLDKSTGELESLVDGFIIQDLIKMDQTLWICTSGDGLIRFDLKTNTYKQFTINSGLPSNFINSITLFNGYLWLGTETGLCRFNPENDKVITYSSIFPLSGISFNRNAHVILKNGHLVWGTNQGAIAFDPSKLQQNQVQGKIYLQNMLIAGRSIHEISSFELNNPLDSLKSISLKYNQNNLLVDVLPLGVSGPGSKFSWKMEGYDPDWSIPSNNRIITYNNLPSGHYSLKIKLYNSSQSQVISERTMDVEVVPPIWKTGWFRLVAFLFLTMVFFSLLHYYKSRLAKFHSEEKIRFFANTTHDIRTLLTLISAPIEELSKEANLSELGQYYLQLSKKQIKQMFAIANQLLDFQKVDIEKEVLHLEMIELVKFIENQILLFEPYALAKKVTIHFESAQPAITTAIDEGMLEKVMNNLLSNAIKYSAQNKTVEVSLKTNKSNWILEVKDSGIGISKKDQRRLFKEFYRAENAINAKVAGSGIGLLLIKNYVVLHGGKILCDSQENEGSVFQVSIPIKTISNQSKTDKSPEIQTETLELVIPDLNMISEEKEMRILIVEDNDDLRNFMNIPLQTDFQVATAVNGAEAWSIIQNQLPDLVVSDIMMPEMDGFELCRVMKSTYETSHIPIILLTALSEKADQLHGLGLGADDYLVKPFDITLLTQKIKSIIRNREVIREKALKLIKRNFDEPILSNHLNDKFIKDALAVVTKHLSDATFGKDTFAFEMNVSPSLLYKKIKSLTNQSPIDFIKVVRLGKALEMIESHKYSITEISELCGFSSVGYFCTVFKKQYGKSPTDITNVS